MTTIERDHKNNNLCNRENLIQLCQEARSELEKAMNMEPRKLGQEVDFAEVGAAKLRDCLIDRIRSEYPAHGSSQWKPVLERVNTALSFIVGVEYPAMGIHRNLLEKALQVLKDAQEMVERIQQ